MLITVHNICWLKLKTFPAVANFSLEVRSCRNAILLHPPNNHTRMLRFFLATTTIIIICLLCYIVKHFFYIPPISVGWWCTTSQTRAFTTPFLIFLISSVKTMGCSAKSNQYSHTSQPLFPSVSSKLCLHLSTFKHRFSLSLPIHVNLFNGSYGNREGGCGLDCYGSGQGLWQAPVNMIMKLRVP
jgi:hypothetical protein